MEDSDTWSNMVLRVGSMRKHSQQTIPNSSSPNGRALIEFTTLIGVNWNKQAYIGVCIYVYVYMYIVYMYI